MLVRAGVGAAERRRWRRNVSARDEAGGTGLPTSMTTTSRSPRIGQRCQVGSLCTAESGPGRRKRSVRGESAVHVKVLSRHLFTSPVPTALAGKLYKNGRENTFHGYSPMPMVPGAMRNATVDRRTQPHTIDTWIEHRPARLEVCSTAVGSVCPEPGEARTDAAGTANSSSACSRSPGGRPGRPAHS
jgi:hypothetical protein